MARFRRTLTALSLALVLAGCVSGPRTSTVSANPRPAAGSRSLAAQLGDLEQARAELEPLVGEWAVRVVDAGGESPVELGTGTARVTRSRGGGFLVLETRVTVAGEERLAHGLLGFDPELARYQLLWASESGSSMRLVDGGGSPQRAGITFHAEDRPVSRLVRTEEGFLFEQLAPDAGGGARVVARSYYTR